MTKDNFEECLKNALNNEGSDQVHYIMELRDYGEKAVPHLILLLKIKNRDVRHAAVGSLGRIGSLDAAESLIEVMHFDRDDGVQLQATIALGNLNSERVKTALILTAKTDPKEGIRLTAVQSLVKLNAKSVLPELNELISKEESEMVKKEMKLAIKKIEPE